MTTTPGNPTTNPIRRHAHVVLAAVVALGIVATSCGSEVGATNKDLAATPWGNSYAPKGYSYYHDSRINETPAPMDGSADHDSRINETP